MSPTLIWPLRESGTSGLIHLTTTVPGVAAATLYTGSTSALFDETATYVGYGCTGTGTTGYTSTSYGTKRAVQNVLDGTYCTLTGSTSYSSSVLVSDFDSGSEQDSICGAATQLGLEGLIAPGDSGGGVFATINSTTYLVGVNSFIGTNTTATTARYGDYSGCVSVCDFTTWINSTIASVPEA